MIYSLLYQGHEYFGPRFERHDPKTHDAITGPVEEFLTHDAGLGYADAKAGESYIRIGVGVVMKPEGARLSVFPNVRDCRSRPLGSSQRARLD